MKHVNGSKRIEFIVDDFRAAQGFANSLPKKAKEARFVIDPRTRKPHKWTPTHVVMARDKNRIVAMADGLFSEVGSAAHAAVVAMPGYGALALRCLSRLQTTFHADHWEASLRKPTEATTAIARRYFDAVYDQMAWQMGQETGNKFGVNAGFRSIPLLATKRTLRKFGIRQLSDLDSQVRKQIFELARFPTSAELSAPNGELLNYQDAVSFAFDLLDAPMAARQDACRFTAAMQMAKAAGTTPDPNGIEKIMNTRRALELLFKIDKAAQAV